ncbi:SRPBCC family protein [Microbacterium sp.]|uniref:SRPBCC family protein n=1 Tax=Microbacterium sp. TaxID=51671 RepID=UPI003F6FF1E6
MFTVSETVTIERPRAEVFDFLIDGRNRPTWDTSVVFEKLTSTGPVGVGSSIHSRLRAMGRESDFHWRVTQFDAPRRMATVSTSGPVQTSLLLEFAEQDASTTVHAAIEVDPTGLLRLVEPVIADNVRSTLVAGLARAKALLERAGPPRG